MDQKTASPSSPSSPPTTEGIGTPSDQTKKMTARKRWLSLLIGLFVLAGLGFGIQWWVNMRYIQSTNDAYVGGNIIQVTPQISGTVIAIKADDTNYVKKGQTLVELDKADAQVALDQSEAQLAKTVRDVRSFFPRNAQLQAMVNLRQNELKRLQEDLARREKVAQSGAISKEEVQHARDNLKSAEAALKAAEEESAASATQIDRTSVSTHPAVKEAASHVRKAFIHFARTILPAPVAGFIAKRNVQLGQQVSAGTPLMAIVPLDQVWVDANFKEPQLANIRLGQNVTLIADIYGNDIHFHGHVVGFGAGTGAAFALLPAQNATGNWIKIVQRLPVRIALDAKELAEHPLQIGLSMTVDVDTQNQKGPRLNETNALIPNYTTDVFQSIDQQANEKVRSIILANSAPSSKATPSTPSTPATPPLLSPAPSAPKP